MKPLPRITPDSEPFWNALRERKLVLPWCLECKRPHLPPGPVCPFCFSERLEWRQASGRGRISTWTVVHKAWFPSLNDDFPYYVVQVELEEGPRLTANVVGVANERLKVGLPVVIDFEDVSLPRFRPAQ
jgi:uncharacterized OB-fold protein